MFNKGVYSVIIGILVDFSHKATKVDFGYTKIRCHFSGQSLLLSTTHKV